MSGKRILAVFCLGMLFLGVFWEWKIYNGLNKESVEVSGQTALNEEMAEKVAYLTFDDGPSLLTEEILEILDEEEIKATFFLIGSQITEDKEELLKKMVEDGHLLGVHTYSHKSEEIYKSAGAYIEDAQKTAERIYEVTGQKPTIYRFPWGSVNCYVSGICDAVIEEMSKGGYEYFDWNVSAEDSIGNPTKVSILKNIKKDFGKYNEPIILMHDSAINETTVEALPSVIEMLREEGYSFGTLDQRSKPYHYQRK